MCARFPAVLVGGGADALVADLVEEHGRAAVEIALERSVRNAFNGGSRHTQRVHGSPQEPKAKGNSSQFPVVVVCGGGWAPEDDGQSREDAYCRRGSSSRCSFVRCEWRPRGLGVGGPVWHEPARTREGAGAMQSQSPSMQRPPLGTSRNARRGYASCRCGRSLYSLIFGDERRSRGGLGTGGSVRHEPARAGEGFSVVQRSSERRLWHGVQGVFEEIWERLKAVNNQLLCRVGEGVT
ncbi:unnamed protein product [Laminaria digitata]